MSEYLPSLLILLGFAAWSGIMAVRHVVRERRLDREALARIDELMSGGSQ